MSIGFLVLMFQIIIWYNKGEWRVISIATSIYKDGNLPLLDAKGMEIICTGFSSTL